MSTPTSETRHSAIAQFELLVGDRVVPVGQVAEDYIMVATPLVLPPGEATLVIDVEGKIMRRHIELPDGSDGKSRVIRIIRK